MSSTEPRKAGHDREALGQSPIRSIDGEIRRRQRHLESLRRRRERMMQQIAQIDLEIAKMINPYVKGGAKSAKSGDKAAPVRTVRRSNLADALYKAMLGKGSMSVTEAAEEVLRTGHRTKSSTFQVIVNRMLIMDPRFRQVERGRYEATALPVIEATTVAATGTDGK